ncbi:hypothetical protein AYO20_08867 [Fonsecaea nubica]|uniref:Uncharacterized protein n=1 Tax=Fonsecaea nubica TaxID=856822 RepID=A0A178CMV5_9EURO|nr:hypothetical protein AYO20_08867 [Fonsecaea nubica]OAL30151.1 hypothetical protein AYO20_08867 [Fonsecaea nubica]
MTLAAILKPSELWSGSSSCNIGHNEQGALLQVLLVALAHHQRDLVMPLLTSPCIPRLNQLTVSVDESRAVGCFFKLPQSLQTLQPESMAQLMHLSPEITIARIGPNVMYKPFLKLLIGRPRFCNRHDLASPLTKDEHDHVEEHLAAIDNLVNNLPCQQITPFERAGLLDNGSRPL